MFSLNIPSPAQARNYNPATLAWDYRCPVASPQQTSLHLSTAVDAEPSPSPSGEHGAPVRAAGEGAGTGLERIPDPHAGWGLGKDGYPDGGSGGLQDLVAEVSMGQVGAVFALEV